MKGTENLIEAFRDWLLERISLKGIGAIFLAVLLLEFTNIVAVSHINDPIYHTLSILMHAIFGIDAVVSAIAGWAWLVGKVWDAFDQFCEVFQDLVEPFQEIWKFLRRRFRGF